MFFADGLVIVCPTCLVSLLGYADGLLGLTFIATHPQHERRGAASLLVRWGLERSKQTNIPIALESTMDAVPFYEKLGFRSEGRIAMELDGVGQDGKSVLYEEMCLVFKPYPWSGPACYKN